MITDEMINDWRINYGLDVSSPEDAGRWWSERNDGKAPAGAVAALGLCIEEIERLRDQIGEPVPGLPPFCAPDREDDAHG